jgi:hypothetical protein
MAHDTDVINFNFTNFYESPNDNENEERFNIDFVIDRNPDLNLIDNIQNTINNINQHFYEMFDENIEVTINYTYQFNTDENIDNIHQLDTTDDFIPFQNQTVIESQVNQIQISEKDKDCPICYETREYHDISQINCGHKFCSNCLIEFIRINRNQTRCPLCRYNITHITFQTHQHNDAFLEL